MTNIPSIKHPQKVPLVFCIRHRDFTCYKNVKQKIICLCVGEFFFLCEMENFFIPKNKLEEVALFRCFISGNGTGLYSLTYEGININLPDEVLYRYLVTSDFKMVPACRVFFSVI